MPKGKGGLKGSAVGVWLDKENKIKRLDVSNITIRELIRELEKLELKLMEEGR